MGDSRIAGIFILIGLIAIGLNIYGIYIINSSEVKEKSFTDFVVPMLCLDYNGTYLLAMPTDSEFCTKLSDYDMDPDDLTSDCNRFYKDKYELGACIEIASIYGLRTEDCKNYANKGENRMSSGVENIKTHCKLLISAATDDTPAGLLIREIFQDTITRKIREQMIAAREEGP